MGRSSPNTISGEDNSVAIPRLLDDRTLDPIVAGLPWYTRFKLIIYFPAWRKALEERGNHHPYHSKENATRNSVILYGHTKNWVLKIFQDDTLHALPPPKTRPPPKTSPDSCPFKFFLTDERIYYLICDQEDKICHVEMLDLTNWLLEWQRLPSLSLDERNFKYIYATTGPDGNSTCMFMYSHIPYPTGFLRGPFQVDIRQYLSIIGNNCSVWQLPHVREAQWHKISDFLTTLQNNQNVEIQPPLFLAIFDQHTCQRHLYKRFTACDYSLNNFMQPSGYGIRYLLVFRDDYNGESLRGLHCFLDNKKEVKLFKLCPQSGTVIKNVSEWNSFRLFWADCRYAAEEYNLTEYNLTALEFSADLSEQLKGWELQFTLPFTKGDGQGFKVSQQGYMHIYVRVAKSG